MIFESSNQHLLFKIPPFEFHREKAIWVWNDKNLEFLFLGDYYSKILTLVIMIAF